MTRSILCAIDISNGDHDVKVLQQAARIAEMEGAGLDLVSVLPDFGESWVGSFFEPEHHDKAVEQAHAHLVDLSTQVLGAEKSATIRHLVATGTAYQQILHTAEEAGSDLIVIGAHKPDFTDYLLGPNAARVVRHAKTSVFVVR